MRNSKTLARLRNGEVARMAVLGHFMPSYVNHAARAGYDCIWLDLEHRGLSYREVQSLMAFFHLYDIDCLLRAPTLEKTGLYRYLEDGASGIMIPHVSTPEKAEELVQAVKFPPIGDRGLDNAAMDSGWRETDDHVAYCEWANRETFLVVQIETPQAVERAEEIVSVPGVDMIFVGPGDLGLRYTLEGGDADAKLEAAFDHVGKVCAKHNKPWACPAMGAETMKRRYDQGARVLANFGEYIHLMNGLNEAVKDFDELG